MELGIIIPARNEAENVATVLCSIPRGLARQIIVVDNGSTDGTSACAREAGAEVVTEQRRGYGQTCLTGLAHLRDDVEVVAFLDADGSDDPQGLRSLLEPIECGEADFVVSSRSLDDARANLTPQQRFGNKLACGLIRLFWGHRFTDLGPMRVIRRDALEKLQMADRTWGWTVEMQIKAVQKQLRVREVPVTYRPRLGGQSKISGTFTGAFRAGAKIIGTISQLWWRGFAAGRASQLLVLGLLVQTLGLVAMVPNGDFGQRGRALNFIWAAAMAVAGYAIASSGLSRSRLASNVALGWAITIGFRLLLLPMAPSGDIWRYLWEGKIQNLGFNVYALAPDNELLRPYRDAYWPLINNSNIAAIYPLAAQLVFRLLAAVWYHPLCFKLVFVVADLGAVWFLRRLLIQQGMSEHRAWWYAWNPLVVYSFAGAGHFDSLMIVCGVASLWFLLRGREGMSVVLLALAIASKMAFVFVVPFFFAKLRRKAWLLLLVPVLALMVAVSVNRPPHSWVLGQWSASLTALFCAVALVIYAKFWRRPIGGVHHVLGWLLMVSPLFHVWYLTWVLALTPLVRLKAWWVLSVSAFAYFWIAHRYAITGIWAYSLSVSLWIWIPFYLVLIPELFFYRRSQKCRQNS